MRSNDIDEVTDYLLSTKNQFGQRIGLPVSAWEAADVPRRSPIDGRLVRLEPLNPASHASGLFSSISLPEDEISWTYMHYGPFSSPTEFQIWLTGFCTRADPFFFAIIDKVSEVPKGFASYQRIVPEHGTIEVGHVYFSASLRRSAAATEAMYLMMCEAFSMGYRRYEWKCDALNVPSHEAARRFGFTYEGTFRQGNVYKGRNRDISWYSILDSEWTWLERAYREWLAPSNFKAGGEQRTSLSECILQCAPLSTVQGVDRGWLL